VDQRERWQALQSHLTTARGLVDAGDRARALEAIDAALAIDPNFLAAHSLRDRILAPSEPAAPATAPVAVPQPPPAAASSEGYANFEARAKRRRVDRRVDAARAALDRRRLRDAAAALEEIIELDPNLPELAELTASFEKLRRDTITTRRGPWLAAAASFAVIVFGASWLHESRFHESGPLVSFQTIGLTTLVDVPAPAPVDADVVDGSAAPTGGQSEIETRAVSFEERERGLMPAPRLRTDEVVAIPRAPFAAPFAAPSEPVVPPASVVVPAVASPSLSAPVSPAVMPARAPEPLRAVEASRAPEPVRAEPAAVPARAPEPASVPVPAPPKPPAQVDEVGLVKQVLQRYRSAYDGLDAQSAQAVFPAVNQAALARAFDGLESQTLTFDACEVQLRGEAAVAVCRGTARYVPKIGSREPRVEPRVWNFSLRKATGGDWTIDSARAER
jgi:hypothetical protein